MAASDPVYALCKARVFARGNHLEVRYSADFGFPASMSEVDKAKFVYGRAKRKLFLRCVALGVDHLLTLTYHANYDDLEGSRKHVQQFTHRMRNVYPKWKYVGVAEFQERGAVHWHMGVVGYQQVEILRRHWVDVVGDLGGNIDVKHFEGDSAGDIARYISKYLGKGFDGLTTRYGHHYVTSRGVDISEEVYTLYNASPQDVDQWIRELFEQRGVSVASQFHTVPDRRVGGMASA